MSPRLRHALRPLGSDESASMLIELVIAMTVIVVAVGALMSSFAASMVSLHHSGTEGTALTLADRQIEAYKSIPYDSIQLASSTIPSGSDPYVTAHSSDATIPTSTGQITGGTTASSCTASAQAVVGCATQTWTGPDNQPYRVDIYITALYPTGSATTSRSIKQITVAVRQMVSGSPGSKIWSRATSEFDQSNPPQ
jgi:Tfp pilus assembly protein PilV